MSPTHFNGKVPEKKKNSEKKNSEMSATVMQKVGGSQGLSVMHGFKPSQTI